MVWTWLKNHVQVNNFEYGAISSLDGEWPSILDYARYYAGHGHLVWAARFSKAHLFATLLGRMIYLRYRFAIAEGLIPRTALLPRQPMSMWQFSYASVGFTWILRLFIA